MLTKTVASLILDAQYNDLDELLDTLELTHQDLRAYCHHHSLPQPPLTDGLYFEIGDTSRKNAMAQYHLTHSDYNRLFYTDMKSMTLHQQATRLRHQGMSELEIHNVTGSTTHYDSARLANELQYARDQGLRVVDIAKEYGISHTKVSQLTRSSKQYRKLTDEEKTEIARSSDSISNLAQQYGTTINTIYVIKRTV